MSQPLPLQRVSALTQSFVAEIRAKAPSRVEAKVTSQNGMPLLCAVEAVFGTSLSKATSHELVWLGGVSEPGRHVLKLRAFQSDNLIVGEAEHELEM